MSVTASSATEQQRAVSWIQVGTVSLMVILSVISYFNRTIMPIGGPTIMREFSLSETAMGTVYSAFLISYTLFMTPGGRWADRFGPRRVLTIAGLGTAAFTGLTGLCGHPGVIAAVGLLPALLVVRFLFGVGTAPLYPSCGRLIANWFPSTIRARMQSLVVSGAPIGGAISPVLFAAMIERFGWRLSFWLAAACTALIYVVWFGFVRDHPGELMPGTPSEPALHLQPHSESPWKSLLGNRNLVLLTMAYFCLGYFEYIFFFWIYYYFGEIRQMGSSESALYVTILMLTMAAAIPIGGWISDWLISRYGRKTGRRLVPLVGLSLSAVLLYVGASGLGVFATVATLSLALGCAAASEGSFWASAIDVGGKDVGSACGIMNTGGNLGGILSPILTPIVAAELGWTGGLHFGSLIVFLGVLIWFFIRLE